MAAKDPSHAAMGFGDRVRVDTGHVVQEKDNASVKRLL